MSKDLLIIWLKMPKLVNVFVQIISLKVNDMHARLTVCINS